LGKKPGVKIIGGTTKSSVFFRIVFACGWPKIYRNHCGRLEGGALPQPPEKNTTTFSVGGIKLNTVKFPPFADKMRVSSPTFPTNK
jgi:hypothetical protein